MFSQKPRLTIFLICLFTISIFTADSLFISSTLNVLSLQINLNIRNSDQVNSNNNERLITLLNLISKPNTGTDPVLILLDHELWETNRYYENQNVYQAHPELYKILMSQADIAAKQSDFDEATARYRFALIIHPNSPTTWNQFGHVLWDDYRANITNLSEQQLSEYIEEITKAFEKSVALDPDNAEFLDSTGWFYFSVHNDPKVAIEYLSKAVSLQEEQDPWTLFKLGLAYRAIGDIEQGLRVFELAEASYVGSEVDFLKQIADIQWRMADYEAAIDTSSLAILRQPDCSELYLMQSVYLISACRIDEAKEAFAEGLSKNICSPNNIVQEELVIEFEIHLANQSCP